MFIKTSSRRGMTLIELLAVIIIVGVIAAILIPLIGQAVGMARSTRCLANIRQLGGGIMLFAADHRNRLPPSEEGVSTGTYPGPVFGTVVQEGASTWAEYVAKVYLDRNFDVFKCPSRPSEWVNHSRGKYVEYGYNQRLSPVVSGAVYRTGMLLTEIKNPTKMILLADSATPAGDNATYGIFRVLSHTDLHPRHSNSTVNVLYVDQHVETHVLRFAAPPADNAPLGRSQFVP